MNGGRWSAAVVAMLLLVSGCAGAGGQEPVAIANTGAGGTVPSSPLQRAGATATPEPRAALPSPTAASSPSPTPTATASPTPTSAPTPTATPSPTPTPIPRIVSEQLWEPMALVGPLMLVHPASLVERIGFHESGHDGAQDFELLVGVTTQAMTMESRGRDTGARTAADIVVDPDVPIRAPVTGTVLSAGTYVLYCEYSDDFVFIEPDARPGWEVKMFHIDGVQVAAGDRVEAGVTVLAPRATKLPFESQVDEFTAEPSWPHVHIEVVDPSIPDRPSPGGGC